MHKATIHILCDLKEGAGGGGNHFLNALKECWKKQNIYKETWQEADIVVLNSIHMGQERKFFTALKALRAKKTLLHRIAGPFINYRPNDYLRDQVIYIGNELFSHGNIFQSHWSREENYKAGMKSLLDDEVIVNAPDPRYFFTSSAALAISEAEPLKIFAMSWSSNPLKGFACFEELDKSLDFSKYSLTFVGNTSSKFKNIKVLPAMHPKELGKLLRKHHVFLFPSQIEACSNALLQGLHCGLITLAFDGSSNPELLGANGFLFKKNEEIPALLDKIKAQHVSTFQKVNLPTIDQVAKQYLDFAYKVHFRNKSSKISKPRGLDKYLKTLKLAFFMARLKLSF